MRRLPLVLALWALPAALVAAGAGAKDLTFAQLIRATLDGGEVGNTTEAEAPLGVPLHSYVRRMSLYTTQTADKRARSFSVVVDRAEPDKPLALVMDRFEEADGLTDFYCFRLGVDGTLEKARRARAKTDGDAASPVEDELLDVSSPTVAAVFKAERDFWLQGRFRGLWQPIKAVVPEEALKPALSPKQLAAAGKPFGLRYARAEGAAAVYEDERAGAEVVVPAGYRLTPAVKSRQVAYDFGMRNESAPFEVRVRFDSTVKLGERYRACSERLKKEPDSCVATDPDLKTPAWAATFRANLTGGEEGRPAFPTPRWPRSSAPIGG